ncbi:uncharacterized protein MELLADRAFT_102256 [Melampsora larici-populina 98AG31]|uniref:Uncharacterized protein n=1 Tax=Melampsora larici-populina (strain 98AG31 / pathotype 3-4-7) TaxID=747676 RepID=F4R7P8_MELLP|nr:uncharacterized protein MELLADRAFT_102256 [Melampsora larici-populina 98AG31]EGG11350.1 hypothetical protein MELLADRAFT_102256 [Melampsora larici-populina 98AG31]
MYWTGYVLLQNEVNIKRVHGIHYQCFEIEALNVISRCPPSSFTLTVTDDTLFQEGVVVALSGEAVAPPNSTSTVIFMRGRLQRLTNIERMLCGPQTNVINVSSRGRVTHWNILLGNWNALVVRHNVWVNTCSNPLALRINAIDYDAHIGSVGVMIISTLPTDSATLGFEYYQAWARHFNNIKGLWFRDTTIDLGKFCGTVRDALYKVVNKTTATIYGFIHARQPVRECSVGRDMLTLTIKSYDNDPMSAASVTWLTKHYVRTTSQPESQLHCYQIGAEVISNGVIKNFDEDSKMWECEVEALSIIKEAPKLSYTSIPAALPKNITMRTNVLANALSSSSTDTSGVTVSYEGAEFEPSASLKELWA